MGERDGWLHPSLATFLVSLTGQNSRGLTMHLSSEHRPVDYARNCVVKEFLASTCEWLLMLDNDMVPPVNLLDMVDRAGDRMDIVVPRFYRAEAGPCDGVRLKLCWESFSGELAQNEWRELVCAGTGVMFVRRRVFERMGKQGWFRFIYDADGKITISEDVAFCQKARQAGFSVWGNQRFEADHCKTIPLSKLVRGVARIGA